MSYENQRNSAIHHLYEEQYGYLVIRCQRFVGAYDQELQSQIEDVVQEAFFQAIVEYEAFRKHPNQVGGLVEVCKNKLRNMRHVQQTRAKKHGFSMDDENSPQIRDDRDEVTGIVELDAHKQLLHRIQSTLSEEEQVMFTTYFLRELSTQETAEATGRTVSSVKSLVFRIRKKIKKNTQKVGF